MLMSSPEGRQDRRERNSCRYRDAPRRESRKIEANASMFM